MGLKSPEKLNYLIVEDVDAMRRSIRAMLKLANFGGRIYEAANGREAWKLLQDPETSVDFIICDYNMPYMSGTELLSRIRENSRFQNTPFLMITAETNMDVIAEAAEKDVNGYMTKPFITAALEGKIRELLDRVNHPDPMTVYLQKARLLEGQNDIDGAIREALLAIRENSLSSRPFRELGRLYTKKGNLEQARLHLERAIDLNKLDVYSYHALGQIYFRLGEPDRALDYFMRAMEISPRHASRALDFARLLAKKNLLGEAEKVLKTALKYQASDSDFKKKIADFSVEIGLFSLSFKIYRELLRDNRNDPELFCRIGLALHGLENDGEAVKYLEKAAAAAEISIEAMLTLARSYLRLDQKFRADKWATQVLRLDPGNITARDIIDKCL